MLKRIIPILLGITFVMSACGPQGTPTMAPADVQNTAVAAAWTMVAATQQAIPTATAVPPTETPSPTPLPTFTALPSPTLEAAFLPTATQAASVSTDPCLGPLNVSEAGATVPIRIENVSGGTITLSLTMYQKNAFGQCGAVSYANISDKAKQVIQLPRGLWYAYAWITFKNGSSGSASSSFELRIGDEDLLRMIIGPETIKLQP